jgi:hypothetical protein
MRLTEEEYKELCSRMNKPREVSLADTSSGPKESKYHNRKADYRDPKTGETITFDSEKERDYYLLLKDRERRGEIRHLNRQYEIEIQPAFTDKKGTKIRAIKYKADFYFYDRSLKSWRVIDVKGFKTEIYKLKKKLLAYKGIIIEEV